MPTIITHGIVGYFIPRYFEKIIMVKRKLIICCLIGGFFPDLDAISFKFHIPYASLFGHRGFSHSILFALILSLVLFLVFFLKDKFPKKEKLLILCILFLSVISHSILDAMTNGGLGVAFFSPFIETRYFFPFRPIPVAPIALSKFFSSWGMSVLCYEILIIWIPSIFLYYIFKKQKMSN